MHHHVCITLLALHSLAKKRSKKFWWQSYVIGWFWGFLAHPGSIEWVRVSASGFSNHFVILETQHKKVTDPIASFFTHIVFLIHSPSIILLQPFSVSFLTFFSIPLSTSSPFLPPCHHLLPSPVSLQRKTPPNMYNIFGDPRMAQNQRRTGGHRGNDRQDFFPGFSNSLFFDPFSSQSQETGHRPEESDEYEYGNHPFYSTLQKQRHLRRQQQQQERQRQQELDRQRCMQQQQQLQERQHEARVQMAAAEKERRQQQQEEAELKRAQHEATMRKHNDALHKQEVLRQQQQMKHQQSQQHYQQQQRQKAHPQPVKTTSVNSNFHPQQHQHQQHQKAQHSQLQQQQQQSQQHQQPGTGRKACRQRRRQRQASAAATAGQTQGQTQSKNGQDDDLDDEAVMNILTNAFDGVYTTPEEEAERAARKNLEAAKKKLPVPPPAESEDDEEEEDEDEEEEGDEDVWEQAAQALNQPSAAEKQQQHRQQQQQKYQQRLQEHNQRLQQQKMVESDRDEEMEQEEGNPQEDDETMEDNTTTQDEEDEEELQPDPELICKSQAELQEIRTSLGNLAHELQQIESGVIPNKKQVLMTEENLTKAMLTIDSVESGGDESIRKQRKELIGRAEQILEKVDDFKRRTKISVPHRK